MLATGDFVMARVLWSAVALLGLLTLAMQTIAMAQVAREPKLCVPPLEFSSALVFQPAVEGLALFWATPPLGWTLASLYLVWRPVVRIKARRLFGILLGVSVIAAWWLAFGTSVLLGAVAVNLPEGLCAPSELNLTSTRLAMLLFVPVVVAVIYLAIATRDHREARGSQSVRKHLDSALVDND